MDHRGVLHSRTLFEEVIRVPLILRGPGVPAGVRMPGPASLVDVVPTILGLLGLPPAPGLDGVDLSRYWDPVQPLERAVFAEADRRNKRNDSLRAIRRGRWKLVVNRFSGATALYDLEKDPGEKRDVKKRKPGITDGLRKELGAFMAREPLGEPKPLRDFDEEELQALRELGYL